MSTPTTIPINTFEEYHNKAHTFITTYTIEEDELRKLGSIHSTHVIKCETTQENGERYYTAIIRKDVWNITCRLADIYDSTENDYAQVCIVMSDNFQYKFNFRYNYSAKAFYDQMFEFVFLE